MDRIFCERLKAARTAQGLTVRELARRVGTDMRVVTLYESGGTTPGIEGIRAFAEALGVSAAYLVDRVPPRRATVCPCCGAELEGKERRMAHDIPRISGAQD